MVRQTKDHTHTVRSFVSYCGADKNRPQKIACDFCAYEAHSLVPNQRIKTPPAPKFGSESATVRQTKDHTHASALLAEKSIS